MPIAAIAVAAAFSLAALAAGEDPGGRERDRAAIRAHIQRIFEAYRRQDRTVVRATHAEDWRGFIRASRHVVRGLDDYMREAEPLLASAATFAGPEMEEFDVRFLGPLAVVSYVAGLTWEVEGQAVPDRLRVLDVYASAGGEWNQVASHVASHPSVVDAWQQEARTLRPSERAELLRAREAVWRAWFAGDTAALDRLLPPETLAINAGEDGWQDRAATLRAARDFAAGGGRLVALEFPRTEVQAFGEVAVLYTSYRVVTEAGGGQNVTAGRGTEVFVRRAGRWVNTGWHLDSGR